jgi:hypothetical protein
MLVSTTAFFWQNFRGLPQKATERYSPHREQDHPDYLKSFFEVAQAAA